jgi:hypothetical protein
MQGSWLIRGFVAPDVITITSRAVCCCQSIPNDRTTWGGGESDVVLLSDCQYPSVWLCCMVSNNFAFDRKLLARFRLD